METLVISLRLMMQYKALIIYLSYDKDDEACKSINRITLVGICFFFTAVADVATKLHLMMMISMLLPFVILNV